MNYSTKNIPIHPKKVYLKLLTDKVEKVIKRMRWTVFFFESDKNKEQEKTEKASLMGFLNLENAHHAIKIWLTLN